MADPVNPANDGVIGALPLLYKNPRPLDVTNFGKHGLRATMNFNFAAKVNSMPILVTEFQHVQKHYPILFTGDPPTPIVALGLDAAENVFITPEGNWEMDQYIPAYMRRYPYILAEVPNDNRLYLCADAAAEVITDTGFARPFFENGNPTELVDQAREFCKSFHQDLNLTQAFVRELKEHDLLGMQEVFFDANGQRQSVGKVMTIDNEKLQKVSDEVFLKFRKSGLLPLLYFAITSQLNWSRLAARREQWLAARAKKS